HAGQPSVVWRRRRTSNNAQAFRAMWRRTDWSAGPAVYGEGARQRRLAGRDLHLAISDRELCIRHGLIEGIIPTSIGDGYTRTEQVHSRSVRRRTGVSATSETKTPSSGSLPTTSAR